MHRTILIRYGRVSEVARFACDLDVIPGRDVQVVVQTHRGPELGTVLEALRQSVATNGHGTNGHAHPEEPEVPPHERVLRIASPADLQLAEELREAAQAEFPRWLERIAEWNLQLDLIDLEWTLDRQKLVLYVLTDRGPETTKLALQAAAAGLTVIEVQPVGPEGLVTLGGGGGGCGSGGCGSGGGCGH